MAGHGDYSRSILQGCALLVCLIAVHAAPRENCDKSACPGPLRYYTELGCKPVYGNPDDCCATEYDCSHLKNLSKDKCYANDHEYNVGEKLKPEDKNPCDIGCYCAKFNDVASFLCAAVDCAFLPPNGTCFNKYSHDLCCPAQVCLEEGVKRATCEVEGKTYMEGEYFQPKSQPDLNCYCMPGYQGENVEPFCKKRNRSFCAPLFRRADDIHKNCAPVFYNDQNPRNDCSYSSRCQNANDTVIHNHDSGKSVSEEENKMCKFGDMTMHIGDELNQGTNYDSVCVKCVCEVPPLPTCQVLPESECDVSDHPPFKF